MTHNKLLDTILTAYNWGLKMKLEKNPKYEKLTFRLITKSIDSTIEDWQIEYLRKRLFDDGFLEYSKYGDAEPFEITPAGIKASQSNWYSSNEEDKLLDKETKLQNLKNLKRSKTALWISIFAFIIPVLISLYTIISNKEFATRKEIHELDKRLQKLETSKSNTNTLKENIIDTLSKK